MKSTPFHREEHLRFYQQNLNVKLLNYILKIKTKILAVSVTSSRLRGKRGRFVKKVQTDRGPTPRGADGRFSKENLIESNKY